MAELLHVTDFDNEVLGASEPMLIDFWAEWCGPCKMIAPIVEQLAEDYKGRMRVGKLDADAYPAVLQSLGIRGIPTLILFKDGKEVQRWTGFMAKERIATGLDQHLSAKNG